MIQVTTLQLYNTKPALEALGAQKPGGKTAIALARIRIAAQDILRPYEMARGQIIEKHAVKDDKGQPIVPVAGQIMVAKEGMQELAELGDEVLSLPGDKLKFEVLEGMNLSVDDVAALLWLFE